MLFLIIEDHVPARLKTFELVEHALKRYRIGEKSGKGASAVHLMPSIQRMNKGLCTKLRCAEKAHLCWLSIRVSDDDAVKLDVFKSGPKQLDRSILHFLPINTWSAKSTWIKH